MSKVGFLYETLSTVFFLIYSDIFFPCMAACKPAYPWNKRDAGNTKIHMYMVTVFAWYAFEHTENAPLYSFPST